MNICPNLTPKRSIFGSLKRRLFSKSSFGRRIQQRHSRPSKDDSVNLFYIAKAADKRLRKLKRGHGFSRPYAE